MMFRQNTSICSFTSSHQSPLWLPTHMESGFRQMYTLTSKTINVHIINVIVRKYYAL